MLIQFATSPVLQSLGQYIGQDHVRFDSTNFRPWSPPQSISTPATQQFPHQFAQPQQVPFVQQPSGGLNPFLNNLLQSNLLPLHLSSALLNNPPPAAQPPSNILNTLNEHTIGWQPVEPFEDCTICLGEMDRDGGTCRQLKLCRHRFHRCFIYRLKKGPTKQNLPSDCLEQMLRTSPSPFLQCPICKKVHGIRTGNRPLNGKTEILSWNPSNITMLPKSKIKYLTLVNLAGADMSHQLEKSSLPGHEGFGTIIIRFTFQPGVCPDATYEDLFCNPSPGTRTWAPISRSALHCQQFPKSSLLARYPRWMQVQRSDHDKIGFFICVTMEFL